MGRHRHRPSVRGGGVVEWPLVLPSSSFVKGAGPAIASDHCQPSLLVSIRPDLPLGFSHQDGGDTCAPVGDGYVDLLDLVPHDHDEAGDISIDYGHSRITDPFYGSFSKRFVGPGFDQFLRNETQMAVSPAKTPDVGDRLGIPGTGLLKRDDRFVRSHLPGLRWLTKPAQGVDPYRSTAERIAAASSTGLVNCGQ